jgi:hypothetical protein
MERSPKGRLYYPSIQIIFDSRDVTLALIIQSTLGHGYLSKKKGANAYVLTFNSRESISLIVSFFFVFARESFFYRPPAGIIKKKNKINGKMITPAPSLQSKIDGTKIQTLYTLIDWLNLRQNSDSSTGGLDIKHPAIETSGKA